MRPMARKPFRAVPLQAVVNRPRKRSGGRGFVILMLALPLAAFTGVYFFEGGPPAGPVSFDRAPAPVWTDREQAFFAMCSGPVRVNCVVDGDTFWYAGEKIRVADIDTPEVSEPQCPREAALGAQATVRLQALLNEGPFTLEPVDRDRDRYGRLLRTVTRGGESVGAALVREGLAEEWGGTRGGWC